MLPINQFCNLPRNFVGRNSVKLSGKKKFYLLSMQISSSYVQHLTGCTGKRYCKYSYNECVGWSA